jgi:hypothetical protein
LYLKINLLITKLFLRGVIKNPLRYNLRGSLSFSLNVVKQFS